MLKRQIEKREYYDEGGIPPGGKGGGGSGGSGGFGGLGGSEEEGFSGVLDETIQVVMATLGFIFLVRTNFLSIPMRIKCVFL